MASKKKSLIKVILIGDSGYFYFKDYSKIVLEKHH